MHTPAMLRIAALVLAASASATTDHSVMATRRLRAAGRVSRAQSRSTGRRGARFARYFGRTGACVRRAGGAAAHKRTRVSPRRSVLCVMWRISQVFFSKSFTTTKICEIFSYRSVISSLFVPSLIGKARRFQGLSLHST